MPDVTLVFDDGPMRRAWSCCLHVLRLHHIQQVLRKCRRTAHVANGLAALSPSCGVTPSSALLII